MDLLPTQGGQSQHKGIWTRGTPDGHPPLGHDTMNRKWDLLSQLCVFL